MKVGNIYINRDQTGAVVETQPFGGYGLSGTGPSRWDPNYLMPALRMGKAHQYKYNCYWW